MLDILSLTGANIAGDVPDFSELNRSWDILTTTGGITGFDNSLWTLDTAGFNSSPSWAGSFSLTQNGNNLVLAYEAVPEPATIVLLLVGLGCRPAFPAQESAHLSFVKYASLGAAASRCRPKRIREAEQSIVMLRIENGHKRERSHSRHL